MEEVVKPVDRRDDRTALTREQAVAAARSTGCEGAHEVEGGWMPCSSPEELRRVSASAESDSWLESSVSDKGGVSPSGRRRKRRVRRWENLVERSYGMTGVPGLGVVSAPPAKPTSPMGDSYASGPSGVITLTAEGKAFAPFTPEVGDPDVYTSPDAARMRARQVGCTGIRRYTTPSGRQAWMPCTTGVTFDRNMGYGAYSRTGSRLESARVEREVRRQLRAAGFSGKKSARRLAATPAKPSERISGSSVNKPGSSASARSASGIVLSAEQQKALVVKAREHNAKMREAGKQKWSRTSSATLKAVMRRGMGAFSSSHRPDVSSRQQWGMGRVNAFLVMLETGRPKNPRYTTDNDLLPKGHPWKERTAGGQSTKKEPIDADRDGWVDEGKPTRRFVGFSLLGRAARSGAARARTMDVAGSGGSRRGKRTVRVSAGGGIAGRARARRLSREIEGTVSRISEGRTTRPDFKPSITGNVPKRISSDRLRRLKPQRVNHNSLVATQRAYPKAPMPEGEHRVTTLKELGTAPGGGIGSTFDHFKIGSGEIPAERKALHEEIIQSILFGGGKWSPKRQEKPAVWFMGGGPASGKTFLRQGGFFDTPSRGEAVHLDADEIKQMIPEFDSLVKELTDAGMDPTAAASAVHSESTYIQRLAMARAAEQGFHIVLDSTGDGGPKSFHSKIDVLKAAGYKVKGRFADVSLGKALSDAKTRQKETGRGVPDDVVIDTHIDVARAVLYGLQYDIFDDLEIVSNENHSSPTTMAAFKDGVLVVHDPKKWSEFISKAKLAFTNDYESDYFGGADRGARGRSPRSKPRKTRVSGVDGADMLVAEPVESLADALPKTGIDYRKVKAVPAEKRAAIAKAYNGLPDRSPEAKAAYDALEAEIREQFRMLTDDLGVEVQFVDEDPYADAVEMMDDVENNGVLKVLKSSATGGHPYWSDETNDMFRAVHDAFGHAATGRGFDRHGEEAAYQAHRSMVKDALARLALATETRGQNSWLIENGEFPEQKMALLDEELAKQAGGLPQMPMMAAVPDVDPQQEAQYDVPATADQDNAFESTRCHHVSGGRRVAATDAETDRSSLYSSLGEDVRLSPESRQRLYEFAARGGQTLEGSGFDESNPKIAAYFKRAKKSVKKIGKGIVADIPTSAVESVPDTIGAG
jgi:hypothetical protein